MKTKFKDTKSKKCCGKCPFKRGMPKTEKSLGYSHPFVYLGQARGPFWLPCHADKNYEDKNSNTETVSQCRGAAIFRSNCNDGYVRPKELLELPSNHDDVFSNEVEFASHYLDVPKEQIKIVLTNENLDKMMYNEIKKPSPTKRFMK